MKSLLVAIWLVVLVNAFYLVNQKSYRFAKGKDGELLLPPLVELDPRMIDIATLGHKGLYEDIIAIWTTQTIVDKSLSQYSAEAVFEFVSKIVRHEPKIEQTYLLPCFILALDFKRPEFCERIIIHGLNAFPNSWRLPMTQGFIFAFQLNQPLKAAAFYSLAASRPESPPYVGRVAKKLLAKDKLGRKDIEDTIEMMSQIPGGETFKNWLERNRQPKY